VAQVSENNRRFAPQEGQFNPIINLDEDSRNSDWTRVNWPLPRYKSAEFMAFLAQQGMSLAQFKTLPVYGFGIERGFIVDDVWVGDDVIVGEAWWNNQREGEQ
jgi:hypothetical protein